MKKERTESIDDSDEVRLLHEREDGARVRRDDGGQREHLLTSEPSSRGRDRALLIALSAPIVLLQNGVEDAPDGGSNAIKWE